MELWLLLILLGLITYFIINRSVARITRTPVWLLWLVMMTPALVLGGWTLAKGEDVPLPTELMLALFVACPLLYWLLIQWGRRDANPPASQKTQTENQASVASRQVPAIAKEPTLRPITKQEETDLRNCFPWGVYYLQNVEYRPQAVLCRGKLRTNPEAAYQTVRDNVEAEFGDRFFLLFQESLSGKPFFALVPNPQTKTREDGIPKERQPVEGKALALGLMLITLFTTTVIGVRIAGFSAEQLTSDPATLLQGLPYALALMAILSIHEMGHYLAAMFYKMQTTLPYFIPSPFFLGALDLIPVFFLGTFGAFIQMRSPVPNRKALFDVGIAGPLAGLIVTIPLLIWGLAHSSVVPLSDASGLLNYESLDPRFSLLLTVLSKGALGSQLTSAMAIKLHPVAVAGYIGLVVTAFNLMPVGQLDGGHVVHAMLGQRIGAIIGQITRLLMLVLALLEPDLLLWAIILLFMPVADEPALNDVSELDNWRDLCGFLAMVVLVSIILPAPVTITRLLNL
ncbi:site-2 protease family protein [Lyngbya aestuarii]|uniref:site-2 protease family protein n=1 Tax=Lyngbya aestuarii TaxID=118322 RepID=UPI00403DB39F